MPSPVRDRMISGALDLLARRGLQATSFAEVTQATQTPRGSIYHHFPGGKAELIEAVLEDFSARLDDALRALHGKPVEAVVGGALQMWRNKLLRNDCDSGCPVAAVTVAANSTRLLADCRQAFDQWIATLASALRAGGVSAAQAGTFATLLVAAVQGAILLARAHGRIDPFDDIAMELRAQAARLAA